MRSRSILTSYLLSIYTNKSRKLCKSEKFQVVQRWNEFSFYPYRSLQTERRKKIKKENFEMSTTQFKVDDYYRTDPPERYQYLTKPRCDDALGVII